jgi:hypothetical protein
LGEPSLTINLHGRIPAVLEHAIDTDDLDRFKFGNPADRVLKRLSQGHEKAQTPHPTIPWQQASTGIVPQPVWHPWQARDGTSFPVADMHATGSRGDRRDMGRNRRRRFPCAIRDG